jgi:hypothetical protein
MLKVTPNVRTPYMEVSESLTVAKIINGNR